MGGEELSHLGPQGEARMVDVGGKDMTVRTARAEARVRMLAATRARVEAGEAPKGEVLATARIAGIQAAKRTGELIPLCHPLPLDHAAVDFAWEEGAPEDRAVLRIEASARVRARTGVEMEALTAASVAALTVIDMLKSVDRSLEVTGVRLLEKTGGRSGAWRRA